MPLTFYNTLTRTKEIFKPIKKGLAKIYGCGPTVYWYQHIGNMRRYVFEDLLKRVLSYNKYRIKHVINITDVGHLTSDTDEGEDKMVKALKREGLSLTKESMLKIADKYTKVFRGDLKKLNIIEPDIWPKATKNIKEMIELIQRIEKKNYTYKTRVGLIFDTSKFKNYSELGRLNLKDIRAGKRVKIDSERRNPSDFALWITNQPNHIMQWNSPWGRGFPGWHIECSAMSMKYLGEHFDIHTGGEEHIPIHHTNEIAQSESATGKKWVNYWLHNRWLLVKGEKMSKSKGHLYILSDLEKKGFNPIEFRYLCLLTHYRKPLNFTLENLKYAQDSYRRLNNIISELKDDKKTNKKYLQKFEEAINDDLNIPKALQVLWTLIRDEEAQGKLRTIKKMDVVFGLDLLKKEKVTIPKEIKKIIKKREEARKNKDWKKADELRKKINKLGYRIDDTKDKTHVGKLKNG